LTNDIFKDEKTMHPCTLKMEKKWSHSQVPHRHPITEKRKNGSLKTQLIPYFIHSYSTNYVAL